MKAEFITHWRTKGELKQIRQTETTIVLAIDGFRQTPQEDRGGYVCEIKQAKDIGGINRHDEANAEFICTAVNSYDELLQELKKVQVTYRDLSETFLVEYGNRKRGKIYEDESLRIKALIEKLTK